MKRVSKARLIFLRLRASDSRSVFAGLCWIVINKGYKAGFARVKFNEIFGHWPTFDDVEPEPPSTDLVSWLATEKTNYKNRERRAAESRRNDAALALARVEAIVSEIEAVDQELRCAWREPSDSEPLNIVKRLEQCMRPRNGKSG